MEARLEGTTPKTSGMMRLLANDSAIDRTDSEGGFRFALGSEGRYRVVASAMGYVSSDPVVVQVPSAEAKDLRIALHRGTSVRVRVLDEAGQPVSRAFVVASPGWGFGLTFTDPAGIFVLGVPEGESGSAVVVPTGRAPLILTDLLPSPEEIVVRTTPGGSLELLVRASPESRSKMTLELRDKSGTDLLSALAFLWSMMGGMENELATAGRIFFPHLAPGLYTVVAGLDGESATLPAEITEGSATRLEVSFP